jgi:ribosome-binding factor A
MTTSISEIKRARKESLFFREITKLFMQTTLDDSNLQGLTISQVSLSSDKSVCTIFFYTEQGKEHYQKLFETLILYKPSLRKAIASEIKSRYVPELIFRFDNKYERKLRLEKLLDSIKTVNEKG